MLRQSQQMPILFVSSEKRFVNQGCHKRLYRHMLFWIILSTFSKLLAPPRAVLLVYCILPSSLCSLINMCTCLERFTNKSFLTLKLLFQFQALANHSRIQNRKRAALLQLKGRACCQHKLPWRDDARITATCGQEEKDLA